MEGKRQREDEDNNDFEVKRHHIDPAQELINNVCKDIRRLGENSVLNSQIDDINYISNPIVAEFEKIDNLRNSILSTIYALIIEQPHKINALSNLILICNAKNFVVAKYVFEYLHSKIQSLLDSVVNFSEKENAGVFNDVKSILKFLSTLIPITENYSIINIYKQLLNFAIDLQNQYETRNGLAQEIYFNTLISIPYLLSNGKEEELVTLINELIEIAQNFKIVDESSKLLQPFDSRLGNFEIPYTPVQMINLILPSLNKLQEKNWNLTLFLDFKPFIQPITDDALSNNTISQEIIKHNLPQLKLPSFEEINQYKPPENSIDSLWLNYPRLLFQVYNHNTEFETVPEISSYLGLFFKDISFDILTNLSFNKNEAALQLSILDIFFDKALFSPPGTSIDQLKLIHEDNEKGENDPNLSTWKIEDVAVESILTMIFQLPKNLHVEIYYYTVLIQCCKESPESIAPVFGRAIRFFYNNLETLDYELKLKFLDWMTTQISNFEFSWKWDEWVNDSEKYANLKFHPKKNFIKNLIAKEIRLSNKKKIKESFVDYVDGEVVEFDEFNKYLNISLFPNEWVINYDVDLYNGHREKIEELFQQKQVFLESKSNVSHQDEIFYNFTNPDLPFSELATKVYEFIIAHFKTNIEFQQLCQDLTQEVSEKFLINLIFQTYSYIGSRSIYSVVSILSRDVMKLKYLSGANIDYSPDEPQFETELSSSVEDRQNWIIESIFRIWNHQPQVIFLVLENLIEFGVLEKKYVIEKCLKLNLIIDNVSCMESINRILENTEDRSEIIRDVVTNIINNMNELELGEELIKIEGDDEIVDKKWLFYEYLGLLKTYYRKYTDPSLKSIFEILTNKVAKEEILSW
ncbi:unnamed protein product [Candida verbasci]|uniref:Nuclear cap-binding protein complex subunit 1 n=1 Tax=Candida verbasci TaxID=1227364 RepID=A0A9W4TVL4_9ASCO|nr:unnamed protein product [Candida verbasci]